MDILGNISAGIDLLETRDWAAIAGAILAALIGVGALAIVFAVEQRDRYRNRVDGALEDVIRAIGNRAVELSQYGQPNAFDSTTIMIASSRRAGTGGPIDAALQMATEIALLACTKRPDRAPAKAIADVTWSMKRAAIAWQIPHFGELAASIRKWRTRELSASSFLAEMKLFNEGILASERALTDPVH